jgi:O-antigen ligase
MIAKLAGVLVGLFYLSGRFSLFGRDHIGGAETILYEVRVWVLLVLIGVTLLSLSRRRERAIPASRFTAYRVAALAILLPVYVCISSTWSIDFDASLFKAFESSLVAVTCICVAVFLKTGQIPAVRHGFWVTIVALTGVMCWLACFVVDSSRMSVLGGGPNTFGRNMGLLFLGSLYLQRRSSVTTAWIWYPMMALGLIMVVLSGSRGALLATFVGGFIYFLVDNRYRMRNIAAVGGMGIVLLGALLTTEMGSIAMEMFEARIVDQTMGRRHMSGREDLYSMALDLGREHPWFGHGLSGYTIALGYNYPHNIMLELFCETGIAGVALLVLLLFATLKFVSCYRRYCDPVIWGAFGLVLSSAMFSGDFFDSRGVFLMALLGSQELILSQSKSQPKVVRGSQFSLNSPVLPAMRNTFL